MKENFIRLDSFCESVRDGTHDTPKPELDGKYLVTSRAIKNNSIDFEYCYFISQIDFDNINKRSLVEKWDVLMTMIGTVGRLLLVKESPDYAIKNIALFKIGDKIKAQWLYYYLSMANVQRYFEMIASGTSQHFIGLGHMRKLKIPNIRKNSSKVVSILSAYDSLIENNAKRIRLLEQMAENLYKEWFVRFRFPGYEQAEFVDGLPKGWHMEKIGTICETVGGGTPSTEKAEYWGGNIKWVTPSDITSKSSIPLLNIEERITIEGLNKSSAKLLPPYSILMTSRASIGFLGMAPEEVCTNQGFISIIPNEETMRMYILYSLKNRREEIIANANGSTFLEISKGRFRKMKIAVPTKDLLAKFESKCRNIFESVLVLERQSALLARQRDLLLPRLMSGKLEVKA